jgi:TPR repeat protein
LSPGQARADWNMRACLNLIVLYSLAEGVPKDLSRANALFKQACDGGFQKACARVR